MKSADEKQKAKKQSGGRGRGRGGRGGRGGGGGGGGGGSQLESSRSDMAPAVVVSLAMGGKGSSYPLSFLQCLLAVKVGWSLNGGVVKVCRLFRGGACSRAQPRQRNNDDGGPCANRNNKARKIKIKK